MLVLNYWGCHGNWLLKQVVDGGASRACMLKNFFIIWMELGQLRVVRINLLRFLARCRTRRLNQV